MSKEDYVSFYIISVYCIAFQPSSARRPPSPKGAVSPERENEGKSVALRGREAKGEKGLHGM